ncbi:MAG: hypothetical protein J6S59_05640 [Clostridia bacterium]|nr:hypothetical protein [Clostridia bacterium]
MIVTSENMTLTFRDAPLQVFGVPEYDRTGELRRLPDEVIAATAVSEKLGLRCPGARLGFRTDSESFTVHITFKTLEIDKGMSIYASQSASVFIGPHAESRFAGLVSPPDYETFSFEKSFKKANAMEDVLIFFPRNELIEDISVTFAEGSEVLAPTPYRIAPPVVFYGSSITEGGCCSNHHNAYSAILSRKLDMDFVNLGFSGAAKGEIAMAEYIAGLDMSLFVYDYDHNAPNCAHLRDTHYPFYKRFRELRPDVPILMLSRPASESVYKNDNRDVILNTLHKAREAGDMNIEFIDGNTFFGRDSELCFVDNVHPNDLGFYKMACTIEPVLRRMLKL